MNIALDTAITEPPLATGTEVDLLLFALDRSRAQFAWKVGGLDADALQRAHPPSAMTLAGIVKHLAAVETRYTVEFFAGATAGPPWSTADWQSDPAWDWHSAADDPPEVLYSLWQDAVDASRAAVAALLAEGGPEQATSLVLDNGESPNLRRALVDLHDEYARHVGHADLFREAIDGLVGEDPPQS
jgi:hypothetical protein